MNSGVRGQKSGRAILTAYPLYADPPLQGWLPAAPASQARGQRSRHDPRATQRAHEGRVLHETTAAEGRNQEWVCAARRQQKGGG